MQMWEMQLMICCEVMRVPPLCQSIFFFSFPIISVGNTFKEKWPKGMWRKALRSDRWWWWCEPSLCWFKSIFLFTVSLFLLVLLDEMWARAAACVCTGGCTFTHTELKDPCCNHFQIFKSAKMLSFFSSLLRQCFVVPSTFLFYWSCFAQGQKTRCSQRAEHTKRSKGWTFSRIWEVHFQARDTLLLETTGRVNFTQYGKFDTTDRWGTLIIAWA